MAIFEEYKGQALSYDFVGDICILNLDEGLFSHEKEIAETLMKSFKSIRIVVRKDGEREGEFRLQKYKKILGEGGLETIHKENGVALKIDISKVYFSPRLSSDRLRVAEKIKKNSSVLVMFCGCGAYNLSIAKHSSPKLNAGIEKNPDGYKYCLENAKLNKNEIKFFCGDVRDIELNENYDKSKTHQTSQFSSNVGSYNYVLMPLPKNASDFLDLAVKWLSPNGIVFYYDFCGKDEEEIIWKKIEDKLGKVKRRDFVFCGHYSPGKYRVCAEFSM